MTRKIAQLSIVCHFCHTLDQKLYFKNRVTECTCMIDLADNDDMLLAINTLVYAHTGRTKVTQDNFLTKWERNIVQYSLIHNRKKGRQATRSITRV